MVAFRVIMTQVRSDRMAQRCVAYADHPTQRLLLYGAHASLAIRVHIWTVRRQHHRLPPTVFHHGVERIGECAVPIMGEVALAQQKAIKMLGELPGALSYVNTTRFPRI